MSSCILFSLSVYFAYSYDDPLATKKGKPVFDSVGILQLAWLFGNEPQLASVDGPDVMTLRKAGMFDLRLDKLAFAKARTEGRSGDDEVEDYTV